MVRGVEETEEQLDQDRQELEQERATLVGELTAKAEELKEIARDLAHSAILSRAQRTALLGLSVVVGLMVIVLITIGLQNGENTDATRNAVNLIQDCLNPDGTCYKNARANQNSNTQLINRFTTAAAICAKTETTEVAIRSCIEEKVNP